MKTTSRFLIRAEGSDTSPFRAGLLIVFLICVLCISCGLETYVYLNPVEIVRATLTWAEIVLPGQSATQYFRNYTIYYRIYLSGTLSSGIIEGPQLNNINPALANDYSAFSPLTIDDNISSVSIDSVFRNRKYYSLCLRDNLNVEKQLYQVLNSQGIIYLDFTEKPPFLTDTTSNKYDLFRAGNFTSQPDRLFINAAELPNSGSNTVNIDVQDSYSGTSYAYVSMYIVATGIDENYSPLFSRPKHIGIFILPD